jgi:hypothetical protein
VNALEAYARACENLSPIVAVYDGPRIELAPDIENRENGGIYARVY